MLSVQERERGRRLGAVLRESRGARSMVAVAAEAGLPVDTLRKIEAGRVPTPTFFTVVAIARALDLPLDVLLHAIEPDAEQPTAATA